MLRRTLALSTATTSAAALFLQRNFEEAQRAAAAGLARVCRWRRRGGRRDSLRAGEAELPRAPRGHGARRAVRAAFLEEAYAMRRFQPVPRLRGRVEVAVGTIKVK
tara:strand:- start:414 stop:731 length:318 start_codon:yes stop_codon:yes gene_type:complete